MDRARGFYPQGCRFESCYQYQTTGETNVEAKRDYRLVLILIVSLSLSFTSGCTSLDTRFDRYLPQSSDKSVNTHETKKYVRIVCSPPVMCCVSYEQTENNKKNEVGICIGM